MESGKVTITDGGSISSSIFSGRPRQNIIFTKEECAEKTGHCWHDEQIMLMSSPPQYPQYCSHCPARRIKTPREAWEYREV